MSVLETMTTWLLAEHAGTTDADRLAAIDRELRQVVSAGVPGAVVEAGCYKGATSVWLRAVLDDAGAGERVVHVYDSFAGLPTPGAADSDHLAAGELAATPRDVLDNHRRWNLRPPEIHVGWFADSLPTELPDEICFAYLDGDFYDSILVSLEHVVPRLAPGGRLVVDDYADTAQNPRAWDGLPGVKRACEDYFGVPAPLEVLVGEGDLAYGRWQSAPPALAGARSRKDTS